MVRPSLLVAVALISLPVMGQDARSVAFVQNRAAAFQAVQNVCKMLYLSNEDLANSFVNATRASLSEVCECAAMLTVAGRTDEELAALVKDNSLGSSLQADMKVNALRCTRRD